MDKLLGIILIIINIIPITFLLNMGIVPFKYFIIFIGLLLLINVPMIYILFKKKKTGKLIISFLSIIYIIGSIVGINYINKGYNFISAITAFDNKTRENYFLLSNNNKDLNNKKIGIYLEDNETFKSAKKELDEKLDYSVVNCYSIEEMIEKFENNEVDAIFISQFHKGNVDEDSLKSTFEVDKIEVTTEFENKTVEEIDDIINIYIAGTDSENYLRSRSDVNMVATVNLKKHEFLLTSIPRDYYVQLYNTTGYKDKLGHASLYGIDTAKKTVEELLNTKIDYYVNVNFNTLVELVDSIGGIEVYSSITFAPFSNNKIIIKKGINHMDGETALAFVRERKAYASGDRQRIINQQTVIESIINKISNDISLINDSVLNTLSKSIKTNLKKEEIISNINKQIDKLPSWDYQEYSLDGTDSSNYTYTFGKQQLYVMEPNYSLVNKVSSKINKMLNGVSLKEIKN